MVRKMHPQRPMDDLSIAERQKFFTDAKGFCDELSEKVRLIQDVTTHHFCTKKGTS